MHKPGLSPGLGKNNYRKQYWNNWCYLNMDCELDNCSVAQSCLTLCNPMGCSTPVFPVPHHLLEFAQVHIHCISDAIQLSHPLAPSSPSALNLSQHQGVFPMSRLFISGDQNSGASASASVLPMNIQSWFPLGLTGLILLSRGLLGVFSSTTVWRHQFFGTLPLYSPALTAICDHWEYDNLDYMDLCQQSNVCFSAHCLGLS